MKPNEKPYSEFALISEMMESVAVIRNFDPTVVDRFVAPIKDCGRLLLTGEGSSRILPAKHAIAATMSWGSDFRIATEGGRQAKEYPLDGWAVFCASNSGRTAEVIDLLNHLETRGNKNRYGLTAKKDTPLETKCNGTHVLSCGWENAVAATKSVVEQTLFYHFLVAKIADVNLQSDLLQSVASAVEGALTAEVSSDIVSAATNASRVYFAGRNIGVAEELTLKANEITRQPSAYLEGTYAVHGIEEVMNKDELVVVVDPFEAELDKFKEVLEDGVGMNLVAISDRELSVPTIVIPECNSAFKAYVELAAGWNLLVEIGMSRQVNLDKPVRARKVGNETSLPAA